MDNHHNTDCASFTCLNLVNSMGLSVQQVDLALVLQACLPPRSHTELMCSVRAAFSQVSSNVCQQQHPGGTVLAICMFEQDPCCFYNLRAINYLGFG